MTLAELFEQDLLGAYCYIVKDCKDNPYPLSSDRKDSPSYLVDANDFGLLPDAEELKEMGLNGLDKFYDCEVVELSAIPQKELPKYNKPLYHVQNALQWGSMDAFIQILLEGDEE